MLRVCLILGIAAAIGQAQPPEEAEVKPANAAESSPAPGPSRDDTHILGIVPNYTSVSSGHIEPISTKTKFWLATQDAVDPFSWVISGVYAGVSQWGNQYPEFGQGGSGYAKRYGGAFADQAIGNYMTEAIFPWMLHQDPRYFVMGPGSASKWKRAYYALTRVIITRSDSGKAQFNYSEILGNGVAAGIAAAYYPSNRNVEETLEKFGVNVVSDAGFNVLREFWPDMRHKIFGK